MCKRSCNTGFLNCQAVNHETAIPVISSIPKISFSGAQLALLLTYNFHSSSTE